MVGKVKWFNDNKGFGFIQSDEGEDVFVHYSVVTPQPNGFRSLREGQFVEYEAACGPKGLQATSATIIPYSAPIEVQA